MLIEFFFLKQKVYLKISKRLWQIVSRPWKFLDYLKKIFLFGLAIDESSDGNVTTDGIDSEFTRGVLSETIRCVSINANVTVRTGHLDDKRANGSVFGYIDAEEARETWWIVVLIRYCYRNRCCTCPLRRTLIDCFHLQFWIKSFYFISLI